MKTNRVVHIGYPKTASTFLQRNVFPYCKGYNFLDFFFCKRLGNRIVVDGVGLAVDEVARELPEGNIIFSYEGLAGSFCTGQGVNSLSTIQNLKKLNFNKVIIVLRRNHDKWIQSIHNHYVKAGGRLTLRDFIRNPSNKFQTRQWYPEMILLSGAVIDEYKKMFGSENVKVFYSEDMYSDAEGFRNEIGHFLETEVDVGNDRVNESIPKWALNILLFTNHFTASHHNPTSIFRFVTIGHVKKLLFLGRKASYKKF